MGRIVLIHWNAAEARERATRLRRAGHRTSPFIPRGGPGLRALWQKPPDAFVIDLSLQPTQGRDVGVLLRQRKATRHLPLVFVGGEREKVARVHTLLPDAVYTQWSGIRGALRRALKSLPAGAGKAAKPVVPASALAGYSGTPLPKKLGIREGSVVALLGAPAGFKKTLGALPAGARLHTQAGGRADVIVLFLQSRADLKKRFPAAARALATGGRLWLAWPKQASGIATDLTQQAVREFGLKRNFVDYKIAAIDKTWSGLCFARRRP